MGRGPRRAAPHARRGARLVVSARDSGLRWPDARRSISAGLRILCAAPMPARQAATDSASTPCATPVLMPSARLRPPLSSSNSSSRMKRV
jgi:hypothetical protein